MTSGRRDATGLILSNPDFDGFILRSVRYRENPVTEDETFLLGKINGQPRPEPVLAVQLYVKSRINSIVQETLFSMPSFS